MAVAKKHTDHAIFLEKTDWYKLIFSTTAICFYTPQNIKMPISRVYSGARKFDYILLNKI